MKSMKLLKTLLLPCAAFLWSSCLLPEDVVSSGEFQPLKTLSISPDSAKVGDNIIITGENFISKKEYNQVWFSPNVKAVIDSATKTQLFLKVPEGAVTGEVVVSNGAYADTVRNFKVLKNYNELKAKIYGLKVIKEIQENWYSSGGGNNSKKTSDTVTISSSYNIIRCTVPSNGTFHAIGSCFTNPVQLPYYETVLDCFLYRESLRNCSKIKGKKMV